MSFLRNKFARLLTVILALQAIVLYAAISRREIVPAIRPLTEFPTTFGEWRMAQDVPLEKDVQDTLKADDTLNRVYVSPTARAESYLFIAFFKTQRTGQSPHSPKNCLPGSGWEPLETGLVSIPTPARPEPIEANRYLAAHGDEKAVVIYWYQSHNRIIASEYSAKFWLVADSIRYHRSDTALVKVVVPVTGNDVASATQIGVQFVQSLYPELARRLPL